MAAIIAQLAAANRKRKQRNREHKTIPPEKSNRILPPFDPCYNPEKVLESQNLKDNYWAGAMSLNCWFQVDLIF